MQVLTREQTEARKERGRQLWEEGRVLRIIGQDGSFAVLNGKGAYLVTAQSCTCPDSHYRQVTCKHQWAARFALGQADDPWDAFEPEPETQEGGGTCAKCGAPAQRVRDGRPLCEWHALVRC